MSRDHLMKIRNAVICNDWSEVFMELRARNISPNDSPFFVYNTKKSESAVGLLDTDGLEIAKESQQKLDADNQKQIRKPFCSVLHYAICVNSPHIVKNCLGLTKLQGLDIVHWSGRTCWELAKDKGHGLSELLWGLTTNTIEDTPLQQRKHIAFADFRQVLLDMRRKQNLRKTFRYHFAVFACLVVIYIMTGTIWSHFEFRVLAEQLMITKPFARPTNRIKLDSCTCDRLAQKLCKNKKCATAGQCLEAGKCNKWTGRCDYDPKPDGTPCNDFDPLTANDKCTAGVCKGEDLCENVYCHTRSCQFIEEGYKVTGGNCNSRSGTCEYRFMPENATCAFELQGQTFNGKCRNNRCVTDSGRQEEDLCTHVNCTTKHPCQSSSGCDPKTGLCGYSTKSDGDQCTVDNDDKLERVCRNSQCVVKDCTCREAAECEKSPGKCDPQTGMCFFERDHSCDEQKLNEEKQMCQNQISCENDLRNCKKDNSKCISMTKICTRDGAPCDKEYRSSDGLLEQVVEIGVCRPNELGDLECVLTNNCTRDGQPCKNDNEAITDARCQDFECVGKDLCEGVVCQNRTQCFLPGLCKPETGLCEYGHKPDDTPCDDGNPNTSPDTCKNGKCGVEEDVCEDIECPPADGCKKFECIDGICTPFNKEVGTFCNDNNERTFGDACDVDGKCVGKDPCFNFTCEEVCSDRSSCNGICEECVPVQTNAVEPAQWGRKCKLNCNNKTEPEPKMKKEFCLTLMLVKPCEEQTLMKYDNGTCGSTTNKQLQATCIDRKGKETWSGSCNHKHVCTPLGEELCKSWVCKDYGQCYEKPNCQSKKIDAKTLVSTGIFSQQQIEKVGKEFDYNGDRHFDSYELNAIFVSQFLKQVEVIKAKSTTQKPADTGETKLNNDDEADPSLDAGIFKDFVEPYFTFLEKSTEELGQNKISLDEFKTLMAEVIARLTLECSRPKVLGQGTPCTPERRLPNVQGYFCRQGECKPEYTSDGSRGPLRFLRISNRDEYYKWLQTVVFPFYANATQHNRMINDGNVKLLYDVTVRWKKVEGFDCSSSPAMGVSLLKEWRGNNGELCYPEMTVTQRENTNQHRTNESKLYKMKNGAPTTGKLIAYTHDAGFVERFHNQENLVEMNKNLEHIKPSLENPDTRVIYTDFALYNNKTGIICKVLLSVQFSASGAASASYTVRTARAPSTQFVIYGVLAVLIVICFLYCRRVVATCNFYRKSPNIPKHTKYRKSATHKIYLIGLAFDFINLALVLITMLVFLVTMLVEETMAFEETCVNKYKCDQIDLIVDFEELRRMSLALSFLFASIVVLQSGLRSCGCEPLWNSLVISAHQMIPILLSILIFTIGLVFCGACLFGSTMRGWAYLSDSLYQASNYVFGFGGGDKIHLGRIEYKTNRIVYVGIIFFVSFFVFETLLLAITIEIYRTYLEGRALIMIKDLIKNIAGSIGCVRVPVKRGTRDTMKWTWNICKRRPTPIAKSWLGYMNTWSLIGVHGQRCFLSREDLLEMYTGTGIEAQTSLMWDYLDQQGLLLTHDQRRARTDVAREIEKQKENEAAAGNLEQSINLCNLTELQKIQRSLDELYVSQWKTKVIFSREMQADQDRFLAAQRKIEATTRKIPLTTESSNR